MPAASDKFFESDVPRINAMIRYHYRINPDKLSNKDWAQAYHDIKFAMELERNNMVHALRQVLSEAFSNK